mmetsp:Transcript_71803/g.191535  ORF Transcript_71803/g.191535 Transcript_71803/m.191535 type:complete len:301 (-) Transcript_71803:2080-2982(-)
MPLGLQSKQLQGLWPLRPQLISEQHLGAHERQHRLVAAEQELHRAVNVRNSQQTLHRLNCVVPLQVPIRQYARYALHLHPRCLPVQSRGLSDRHHCGRILGWVLPIAMRLGDHECVLQLVSLQAKIPKSVHHAGRYQERRRFVGACGVQLLSVPLAHLEPEFLGHRRGDADRTLPLPALPHALAIPPNVPDAQEDVRSLPESIIFLRHDARDADGGGTQLLGAGMVGSNEILLMENHVGRGCGRLAANVEAQIPEVVQALAVHEETQNMLERLHAVRPGKIPPQLPLQLQQQGLASSAVQ